MSELGALFLAGLALFFTGVGGVKTNLQQLSGRRFRLMLANVTDRPFLAGLLGVLFGAITQSASAVAFILAGMVATGMVTLRRALPVIAASNMGTAVLVFLAVVDIRLAALYLLGVTGLMISFRVGSKFESLLGALFSIGLLFYGLNLMKEAFAPLPGYDWFRSLAVFLQAWTFAPFLLGAALRMVIQSSSAIGVIAIALQTAGLFTEFQCALLICGAGPGVALAGLFLSGNLSGPPRQAVLFQSVINLISGTLLGLFLMIFEYQWNGPLVQFIDGISRDANDHLAWIFLMNMTGCLVVGLAISPWAERLLAKLSPPTLEQDISRPAYLHDEALSVPDTAVNLADKEQQRQYSLIVRLLDSVREDGKEAAGNPEAVHAGAVALGGEIHSFLNELINRKELDAEAAAATLQFERRQENLTALLETMNRYVATRGEAEFGNQIDLLLERLTESLHLILTMAADAWRSEASDDIDLVMKLTEDRGDMMERLRRAYQMAEGAGAKEQSSALFYATTLFERAVWLTRQIALSLK